MRVLAFSRIDNAIRQVFSIIKQETYTIDKVMYCATTVIDNSNNQFQIFYGEADIIENDKYLAKLRSILDCYIRMINIRLKDLDKLVVLEKEIKSLINYD